MFFAKQSGWKKWGMIKLRAGHVSFDNSPCFGGSLQGLGNLLKPSTCRAAETIPALRLCGNLRI